MSGPSAIAKPMSAKIAVSSSITWLSGWIRPASAGASRKGSVTSTDSDASRASSAADFSTSRRSARDWVTLSLARLIAAPCVLRSSGDILPSVESSAEIEPFLPSAATRTASSAASSDEAAICFRISCSSVARSDMAILFSQDAKPVLLAVMPELVSGICVLGVCEKEDVDGRVKPGHDDLCRARLQLGRERGLGLLGDRLERGRLVDRE